MRIVVHGQQAFGKAVLEALLKRGENVVAVYVAPTKPARSRTRCWKPQCAEPAGVPARQLQEAGSVGAFRALKPTCR
jgi:methionyl-tRNA formyltransferase